MLSKTFEQRFPEPYRLFEAANTRVYGGLDKISIQKMALKTTLPKKKNS